MNRSSVRDGHSDARSTTESFYGRAAGQSIYEPVHAEDDPFSPPIEPTRDHRRDSSSTFFGRNSMAGGDTDVRQNAGASSLYGQPRSEPMKGLPWEEDNGQTWDIYADFNNAGPRYSGAQNLGASMGPGGKEGYRELSTPEGSKLGMEEHEPVEMVTVPRFGPEWSRDELRAMTKRGRGEEKHFNRQQRWREWSQGERGIFGRKWLTRKVLVWVIFFSVIITAVTIAICLPRIPSFGFNPAAPLTGGAGTPSFTRGPEANFTFNTILDLEMNTGGNVIPIYMNSVSSEIYLADTSELIATGKQSGFYRKANSAEPLNINMTFHYSASNDSDATWNLVYNACKSASLYASGSRPGLNIVVIIKMKIRGMIGSSGASTSINGLNCPIQLPTSSV